MFVIFLYHVVFGKAICILQWKYVASIKSNSRFTITESESRSSTVAKDGIPVFYVNSVIG